MPTMRWKNVLHVPATTEYDIHSISENKQLISGETQRDEYLFLKDCTQNVLMKELSVIQLVVCKANAWGV